MNRLLLVVAALCVAAGGGIGCAACGSSAKTAARRTTTTKARAGSSSAPRTTRAVTPTTRHLSAVEADTAAQFALTGAINAAQSIYQHSYDYTAVSPASLAPLVPTLHFGTIEQAGSKVVGVLAQDRNDVLLVARSASGRWYCVTENAMDGISYGEGPARSAVDSNGECQLQAWPPPGKSQPLF